MSMDFTTVELEICAPTDCAVEMKSQKNSSVKFSLITATKPNVLSKGFGLLPDGNLQKHGGGKLVDGEATTLSVSNASEFAAMLETLNSSQALVFGVSKFDQAHIKPKDSFEVEARKPIISRTQEHFSWPKGAGVLMIDYDPVADADAM